MSDRQSLEILLSAIAEGKISPQEGIKKLKYLDFEPIGDFAKIDHHRQLRTGFPEVIWSQGKTPEQMIQIIPVMQEKASIVMATRLEPEIAQVLQENIPDLRYYPMAKIAAIGQNSLKYKGKITIVTAGTADLPVAEESAITAQLCGFEVERLWDVGVAGIHRLLSHRHLIAEADVLIVVAGM
ncbi:1-(5-phosphoribosyl)-5-amino-4-imidazole-carboxylate carboxylase, partial [Geminocystis sp. GBBB08]|uniref:AIR carboxylase family protein n=1 Tax=Geminocystis sp. GBBB08 TaxID=2604140 RepID=UPI0027E28767